MLRTETQGWARNAGSCTCETPHGSVNQGSPDWQCSASPLEAGHWLLLECCQGGSEVAYGELQLNVLETTLLGDARRNS